MEIRNDSEYEVELNLKDMLFHVLYRWRSILLVALVCALVLGGHQFISLRSSQNKAQLSEEEQVSLLTDEVNLTSYKSQVESLTKQLEDLSKYQAESVYFRLDSQSVWTASAKFLVKVDPSVLAALPQGTALDPADNILGAYVFPLASSGEDELMAAFGTENPAYAAELMIITPDPATNAIDITVKGNTRESAEKGLSFVQEKIVALTESAQKIDPHTLILIGQSTVQGADADLAKAQQAVYKSIEDNQKLLATAQQKVTELEESSNVETGISTKALLKRVLKRAIIGFLIGAFLMAGLYLVRFVLQGTLSGGNDLTGLYGVPILGEFDRSASIHSGRGLDKILQKFELKNRTEDSAVYARIASLIAEKEGMKNLLLLTTLPGEKIASLQKELSSRLPELSLKAVDQFQQNQDAISNASDADAVLLVEKKNVSKNKAIDSMAKALALSKANVLGAVVL